MQNHSQSTFSINELSRKASLLDHASQHLLDVMDEQVNAVVSSEADKIVQCTEKNVSAQQSFMNAEKAFMNELAGSMPESGQTDRRVSLELLMEAYPEHTGDIIKWKQKISHNIEKLQRKQKELVDLLDFAQQQNKSLMQSLYGVQDAKNTHYSQQGVKTGVMSGMAVNQEG